MRRGDVFEITLRAFATIIQRDQIESEFCWFWVDQRRFTTESTGITYVQLDMTSWAGAAGTRCFSQPPVPVDWLSLLVIYFGWTLS